MKPFRHVPHAPAAAALGLTAGLGLGAVGGAAMSPPTEHAGLTVESLGVIPPAMMQRTVGLEGHRLQLRAITIAPGGQIAKHAHADRPGLVKVVGGEWIEGRPGGEEAFPADRAEAIVEDGDTVHWFHNRGDEPATAIVCDVTPEG